MRGNAGFPGPEKQSHRVACSDRPTLPFTLPVNMEPTPKGFPWRKHMSAIFLGDPKNYGFPFGFPFKGYPKARHAHISLGPGSMLDEPHREATFAHRAPRTTSERQRSCQPGKGRRHRTLIWEGQPTQRKGSDQSLRILGGGGGGGGQVLESLKRLLEASDQSLLISADPPYQKKRCAGIVSTNHCYTAN